MTHPHSRRLARVLLAIEGISRRHHRLVLLVAVLVFVLGTALSATLRLETDILELLPQRDPAVRGFRDAARIFGTLDFFPIVIDAPPGQEAEDYEGFADRLAERLRAEPAVRSVDARLAPDSPLVSYFQERLPLLLRPDELDELAGKLTDEAIRSTIADDRRVLALSTSPDLKQLLVRDPLRLAPLILRKFSAGRSSDTERWSGYPTSTDGRALLLFVRPGRPAQDVASASVLVNRVKEAVEATTAEMALVDPELHPPRTLLGGRYAIAVEDNDLILSDIGFTMSFAFLGVVGLYLFCYRRFGAILYSVLPLLLGQVLTFTLARLAVGSLNSATATSAALLMGLGTDFTIVMYARYVEERTGGAALEEASRKMMGEAALGVYTGALTSAGTFGALMATAFVGLRQFGFLVGSGILLCLVSILWLLPALVRAFEGPARKKPAHLYVHSFGFEHLITLARRHPLPVVVACLLVTGAAIPCALKLRFSESITDLRSANNSGVAAQDEIVKRFGQTPNLVVAMSRGADQVEVEARARRVQAVLARWEARGVLSRVEGLAELVPTAAQQGVVRRALVERGAEFDPARIEAAFRSAIKENGFKEAAFEPALRALLTSLRPADLVSMEDVAATGGADFVARFRRADGSGHAAATYFSGDLSPEAHAELVAADPTVTVAGVRILTTALKRTLRRDMVVCLGLGFALVSILLAIDFRSVLVGSLALVQLVVGLLWMLGAMWVFDVSLTMVNAFAMALLLGVGIDYGIHILHRLRGPDAAHDASVVLETGKAVAMAAMTNVVGFGVLVFSNYPGLQGLGKAAAMGSLGCMLTALTLMPALERLLPRRAGEATAPVEGGEGPGASAG